MRKYFLALVLVIITYLVLYSIYLFSLNYHNNAWGFVLFLLGISLSLTVGITAITLGKYNSIFYLYACFLNLSFLMFYSAFAIMPVLIFIPVFIGTVQLTLHIWGLIRKPKS